MHRYQLMSQLGDGSFGVVSKAMHTQTGEIVAVKKMKQRFNSWEECLALREIQSLRRLQHPNIIKLKEVVRENTELFMIFEFMEMNVYQITRLRSEQVGSVAQIFNEKEIRSVIAQTLLGLLSIHKGGFMHRDLKPENLLTKGDVVKIADFGLAKEIRSRPPFTEYVSTRWYRAPEIILRSTHYNSPIDIWACGVIFAELYINRPLFPGASDSDQLFKICSVLGAPSPQEWDEGHQLARRLNIRFPTMAPTPLRQLLSNASPAAVDLIEQMLRFNPSDRPTVQQCLQHPFFTGSASNDAAMGGGGGGAYHSAGGTATVSSSMFMGISSGQPHNPFHMAAGLPAGGALGQSASGIGGLGAGGGGGGQQQPQQQQGGSVGGGFGGAGGGGGFHQGTFGAGGGSGSNAGSNAGGVGGVGPLHPARNNSPTPGIAAAPVGSYGSYGGGGGAPMSYGGSIGGGGGGVPGMNYGYGGVGGGGAGGGGANTGRPLGGVGGAGVGGSASWGPSIGASGASGIPPYSSATQGGGGGVPGYSYGGVGGAGSSALSGMSGMSGIGSGGGHHHAGSPPSPNQQYGMQYGGSSGGGAYSHGVGVGSGGGGGFSTGGVGYAYGGGAGGVGGVGGVRGAGLGGDGRSSSSVHGAPNFHSRTSSSGYEDLAQY